MIKPRVKKKKTYWLVYTNKKEMFKCYSIAAKDMIYNLLLKEIRK